MITLAHATCRNTRPGQGPRCCQDTAAQWEPKFFWIAVMIYIYMSLLVLLDLFRIELQTTHTRFMLDKILISITNIDMKEFLKDFKY